MSTYLNLTPLDWMIGTAITIVIQTLLWHLYSRLLTKMRLAMEARMLGTAWMRSPVNSPLDPQTHRLLEAAREMIGEIAFKELDHFPGVIGHDQFMELLWAVDAFNPPDLSETKPSSINSN